jgi:hypothetical protein
LSFTIELLSCSCWLKEHTPYFLYCVSSLTFRLICRAEYADVQCTVVAADNEVATVLHGAMVDLSSNSVWGGAPVDTHQESILARLLPALIVEVTSLQQFIGVPRPLNGL